MAREGLLPKVGLALGGLVAVIFLGIVLVGSFQHSRKNALAGPSSVPKSDPGWEIRYMATRALALHGSDHVKDKMDELKEMLDEEQQRQNFRTVLKNGQETVNEVEAFQVLTSTLKTLVELHQRKPALDLSPLYPAIEKLAQSTNPALRSEALHTKVDLGIN